MLNNKDRQPIAEAIWIAIVVHTEERLEKSIASEVKSRGRVFDRFLKPESRNELRVCKAYMWSCAADTGTGTSTITAGPCTARTSIPVS
jgi:hypothetical protein